MNIVAVRAVLLILCAASPVLSAPSYRITTLGFDDLEHTHDDGYKYSNASGDDNLNEAGQAIGYSERYNGGSTRLGTSTWFYDGAATILIGLTGPEHTRSDGWRAGGAGQLNEAGQVIGGSQRYNGGGVPLGSSAWLYTGTTTVPIGLTGVEHTRNDGYKFSGSQQLNEAGQVLGRSERYNGGNIQLGHCMWLYDGATTIDIGLTGPEHTRNDGYKESFSDSLNEGGQVWGRSDRYNGGSTYLGQSIWLYDGATTINIGLTGPEHTRNDGYKYTRISGHNEVMQFSGDSLRYNGGNTDLGQSAWLYNGVTTIDIGLTGVEYTRNDGYKRSYTSQPNEAGQAVGGSHRYNGGGVDLGVTAWLHNGTATIPIGLTGAEHTRNDGYLSSSSFRLNEAGQAVGHSERYNGGVVDLGLTAWLYDGTTTIPIGLTGAEHTRNDGYKYSFVGPLVNRLGNRLNEAGQIVGSSRRYDEGSVQLGQSAWLFNGTTTIEIGLTGAEHTRDNGFRFSEAFQLNEAGQAMGYSERYDGGSDLSGYSAWFYDGVATIDIGLTGPEYTREDGFNFSEAIQLNEAGQVYGYAQRYNGGSEYLGQDAWLYDPGLDQTFPLQLSMRSDGYSVSDAKYLGEDGLVLGTYTLFDALDNDLGLRAFYFTVADGLHDLGSLVEGGLAANGWEYLAEAIRANDLGQILGVGKLTSQSGGQMAYLLTPVPEPDALFLALAAAHALLIHRRI